MVEHEREAIPRKPQAVSDRNELVTFLRLKQVKAATGMSRSWIYAAIVQGIFPAPINLGPRAVAWNSQSIAAWQAGRIEAAAKRREVLQ